VRPSTVSASEAPTSPRPLKLRTNSSASISNAESQRPSIAPSCKECLKLLDAANRHSPTIDLQLIPNAEETIHELLTHFEPQVVQIGPSQRRIGG
jgi:hypothetical protein